MRPVAPLTVGAAAVALLGAASACSWSRFDSTAEDAPIVLLGKPNQVVGGFGSSLATASLRGEARLLATGPARGQGAAVYNLGGGDQPTLDPVDSAHCAPDNDPCWLGRQTAAMSRAVRRGSAEQLDLCFVAGLGDKGNHGPGLLVRCADGLEYLLPAPEGRIHNAIQSAVDSERGAVVTLATDTASAPALLAGFPNISRAWFYHPLSPVPLELVLPAAADDESFGKSAAILRTESGDRILAVGAPEERHVWLFRAAADEEAQAVGCLGGVRDFGRALASGRVNGDRAEELVVADANNVTVFDGEALSQLTALGSAECSLAALPPGAIITSFGCGATPDVCGCDDSDFGAALAVGDLDGDGDGEVVVGAPRMTVREEARAGALLVYDAEGDAKHELTEVKFISSADADDLLGSALVTPRVASRHVIAAGAPGNGKVAVFYCSEALPAEHLDERCR